MRRLRPFVHGREQRHRPNAAANDPRIKATVASTMYDMPRVGAWEYFDKAHNHTDLYDGGGKNYIPFDKIQEFFDKYLYNK